MYGEAEPLYDRAIAIGEKALGLEHADLAVWLNNRADLSTTQVRTTSVSQEISCGVG